LRIRLRILIEVGVCLEDFRLQSLALSVLLQLVRLATTRAISVLVLLALGMIACSFSSGVRGLRS